MNEPEYTRWRENNERYLAAALEWLRIRLQLLGSAENNGPAASGQDDSGAQLRRAEEALAAAADMQPSPALQILSRRLGLSGFESSVLLLCAAPELDSSLAALCARAQGNPAAPYPTFALALALFEDPAWEALSPRRPLRYWRLLEINQPGAQPLSSSALRADERIVSFIKGLNEPDDSLENWFIPFEHPAAGAELSPSQETLVEKIVRHLQPGGSSSLQVQLTGPDHASKQAIAGQAAERLGLRLRRLPVAQLPAQTAQIDAFARLWQRESILMPLALYLDCGEAEQPAALARLLTRSEGVIFFDTYEVQPGAAQAGLVIEAARPTPAEQQAAWQAALESGPEDTPALLAGQFNLDLGAIRRIAHAAGEVGPAASPDHQEHLWEACLQRSRSRMNRLAQQIDCRATWEDIVLPEEETALLHQLAAQVRQRGKVYDQWGFRRKMNRGLGISALFAGESGTGKTMAAEVLANDLQLNLYRIDLSAVVSKYIGETEKNLRRLFDAAEDGGAILFFDEADALFGKRSEVKDSHDRYANIEINYLLQRIEAYRGLAILASNRRNALDQAFLRRLRFIVNFPFPGKEDRKRIWQRVFPPEVPREALDYERLAGFSLTGGSIHNIALSAAFSAAEAGGAVSMPLLLSAARNEYLKLERPLRESSFRWTAPGGGNNHRVVGAERIERG